MYHPFTFNYLPFLANPFNYLPFTFRFHLLSPLSFRFHKLSPLSFRFHLLSPFFPIPLIISLSFRFHQWSPHLLSDPINYLPFYFPLLSIISPFIFRSYQLSSLLSITSQLSRFHFPILSGAVVVVIVWYAISAYHHKNCELEYSSWRGVFDTTLFDKVCHWLVTSRWFSPGTPVSSTYKTDGHDITEILSKLTLNSISLSYPIH